MTSNKSVHICLTLQNMIALEIIMRSHLSKGKKVKKNDNILLKNEKCGNLKEKNKMFFSGKSV